MPRVIWAVTVISHYMSTYCVLGPALKDPTVDLRGDKKTTHGAPTYLISTLSPWLLYLRTFKILQITSPIESKHAFSLFSCIFPFNKDLCVRSSYMRNSSHSLNARDGHVLSTWTMPSSLSPSNALGGGYFCYSHSQGRKLRH